MAKKTAVKKIAPKKTAQGEFDEIQAILKDLRLDLNRVTKKIEGLCHNPLRPSPDPPPPPKK